MTHGLREHIVHPLTLSFAISRLGPHPSVATHSFLLLACSSTRTPQSWSQCPSLVSQLSRLRALAPVASRFTHCPTNAQAEHHPPPCQFATQWPTSSVSLDPRPPGRPLGITLVLFALLPSLQRTSRCDHHSSMRSPATPFFNICVFLLDAVVLRPRPKQMG